MKKFGMFLTLFLLLTGTTAFAIDNTADNGRLRGVVKDQKGETVPGAIILITNTQQHVISDLEGKFEVDLKDGDYDLEIRLIGFSTKELKHVNIKKKEEISLDITLVEEGTELSEVVVKANYANRSVATMYMLQRANVSISNGISSDIIRRSPDKNAGEALRRISGLAVIDNKYVVIRGLLDRYNAAMMNGAILPSSEADRRTFSFNILPSNTIERMEVNKTASANLPGDFAGGLVQVYTRDIPNENYFQVSVGGSYTMQSTFHDNKHTSRGKSDWLTFDDGGRQLPSGFPATRQEYNKLNIDKQAAASRLFPNNYAVSKGKNLPGQNYQITWGKRKEYDSGARLGQIIAAGYRMSQTNNLAERFGYESQDKSIGAHMDDSNYNYTASFNALYNIGWEKDEHRVYFRNMYFRNFENIFTERTSYSLSSLTDNKATYSQLTEMALLSSQLGGKSGLSKRLTLDWNLNYSRIDRDEPDWRSITYSRSIDTDETFLYNDDASRRFYSKMNENAWRTSFDLTHKTEWSSQQKLILKAGALGQIRKRDFDARVFRFEYEGNGTLLPSLPTESIFNPENIRPDGFIINEITNNTDEYKASATSMAGYLMATPSWGKLSISAGVRVEYFGQNLSAINASAQKVDLDHNDLDILPSANISFAISEKQAIRLSGSQTVSRAEFRELAPFSFYDFMSSAVVSGNTALKRGKNTNMDLRWEIYPKINSVFSASIFYKVFDNPIEKITNSASNAETIIYTYKNVDQATASGVEIDFRHDLGIIASFLQQFTLYGNVTYIHSAINTEKGSNEKRAMQGQSPYLINLGLQYTAATWNANILFNQIGTRIYSVGYQGFPDIYEKERAVMDLQLAKTFLKKKGEFRLNISDILAQKALQYQNLDNSKKYNKGTDRAIFGRTQYTSFSVSFAYKF